VSLSVEMRLQMIENSNKLKYYFYTFVLIFQRYRHHKVPECSDYNINEQETSIITNLIYFGDLLRWNEAINYRKHE
jgi:hypothetical protein